MDRPGKLGVYEILAPLRAGGMGEVYRARDPRLKRDVAVKILSPETVFLFPIHRVFPKKGSLSGFYQIYNAHFPAAIRFKLYRDKTVFVNETPEREIANDTDPQKKSLTNFFSVPYNNLAPGAYELEIIVKDKRCTASTRAGFEIAAPGS